MHESLAEYVRKRPEILSTCKKPAIPYPQEKHSSANVIPSLFLKPHEKFWIERLPDRPTAKKYLFYLGCYATQTHHLIATAVEVLKKMGIDFATIGGVQNCCGHPFLRSGHLEAAESFDRRRTKFFEAFSPEEVIQWDSSCTQFTINYTNNYVSPRFQYKSIEQFVAENASKIPFSRTTRRIVAIHDHYTYSYSFKGLYNTKITDYESPRKALSSIPGVRVIEMANNRDSAVPCGCEALYAGGQREKAEQMNAELLEEAVKTGADTLAVFWQACYRAMLPYEKKYPIEIKHFIEIVGESLGISHENKFKEYTLSSNVEEILEDAQENLEANGFNIEEVRDLVAKYFQLG